MKKHVLGMIVVLGVRGIRVMFRKLVLRRHDRVT